MLRGQTTTHDAIDANKQDRMLRSGPASQQIIDELRCLIALLAQEQRLELAKMIREEVAK